MKYGAFQKVGPTDIDLCVHGVMEARRRYHEVNGSFPNVVCHSIGDHQVLGIQKAIRDTYGVSIGFVEVCELPRFAWFVDRIGEGDTTPIGSTGA